MFDEVGPFFALEVGPLDDDWMVLDRATAHLLVDDTAQRLGVDERRVAASIMFQGLSARLVSPVLAGLDEGVLLGYDEPAVRRRPGELLELRCAGLHRYPDLSVPAVAAVLLDRCLHPLVTQVAQVGPVAVPLLWGNVASSLVGALRALEMRGGGSAELTRIVAGLLEFGPLAGTMAEVQGRLRRRSCCLYYRVPGGGYCGDCALT